MLKLISVTNKNKVIINSLWSTHRRQFRYLQLTSLHVFGLGITRVPATNPDSHRENRNKITRELNCDWVSLLAKIAKKAWLWHFWQLFNSWHNNIVKTFSKSIVISLQVTSKNNCYMCLNLYCKKKASYYCCMKGCMSQVMFQQSNVTCTGHLI